jgi:hypothetical protein
MLRFLRDDNVKAAKCRTQCDRQTTGPRSNDQDISLCHAFRPGFCRLTWVEQPHTVFTMSVIYL